MAQSNYSSRALFNEQGQLTEILFVLMDQPPIEFGEYSKMKPVSLTVAENNNIVREISAVINKSPLKPKRFASSPTVSPMVISDNQRPKRPMSLSSKQEFSEGEQCEYITGDMLSCERAAESGFPLCIHHLHVAASKFAARKQLKKSRSGSTEFPCYRDVWDFSIGPYED